MAGSPGFAGQAGAGVSGGAGKANGGAGSPGGGGGPSGKGSKGTGGPGPGEHALSFSGGAFSLHVPPAERPRPVDRVEKVRPTNFLCFRWYGVRGLLTAMNVADSIWNKLTRVSVPLRQR